MLKRREAWALQLNADNADDEIRMEQQRGYQAYGRYNSMHEAYAMIKEELDEFFDSVRQNNPDPRELLQVVATARRAMIELCEFGRQEMRSGAENFSEVRKPGESPPRVYEPGLD